MKKILSDIIYLTNNLSISLYIKCNICYLSVLQRLTLSLILSKHDSMDIGYSESKSPQEMEHFEMTTKLPSFKSFMMWCYHDKANWSEMLYMNYMHFYMIHCKLTHKVYKFMEFRLFPLKSIFEVLSRTHHGYCPASGRC